MFDIADIHMIKMISELGSINKAADSLNMSQPTLSKKVSRLEQKINMALFYRDNVGMLPTEAAKLLLKKGDELSDQLAVVERDLTLMAGGVGGTVNIGVGPIVEQTVLPKVLLDFAEGSHQFNISVMTQSAEKLIESLKRGQIDMAIGPFTLADVPSNMIMPLKIVDYLVGAVRQDHELCQQQAVSFEQMHSFNMIAPSAPKHLALQANSESGGDFTPKMTCENYALAKRVVMNSDYVTVGPESLFYDEFLAGDMVKLTLANQILWQSCCVLKPEISLTPMIKVVLNLFAQYMENTE